MSLTRKKPMKPGRPIARKPKRITKERRESRAKTMENAMCFCKGALYHVDGAWTVHCEGNLEESHFIKGRRKSLVNDPLNKEAVCTAHHRYFEEHQAEWHDFIESKYPGRIDELKRIQGEFKKVRCFK